MQLATLSFTSSNGWSAKPFPSLDSPNTLVLAFGASAYGDDPAPIRELKSAYRKSHVLGCSTSGEILGAKLTDDSVTVAIMRFDHSRVDSASAVVSAPSESFTVGQQLANSLSAPDLRAILVLSDGLSVNGSELVRGLNSQLSEAVVVTGGLAGDGARFERTWVIGRDGPQSNLVSAVGLYGDRVEVRHGSRGGWDIFGPERLVTRSKENVLYELDGKPALALYKQYLGDRASGLPATALLFPLAVRASAEDSKVLVRTVLSVNEADQSMTFAGNVAQGSLAQLMRANFERLIEGASAAASQACGRERHANARGVAIAISCVGRRLILGERTEEEIEAALRTFPAGTQQIGFYSYGEISPYASGHCDLHNQTMTLTAICER